MIRSIVPAVLIVLVAGAASTDAAETKQPGPPSPGALGYQAGDLMRTPGATVVAEVEGHPITLGEVGEAIRALPTRTQNIPFEQLFPAVLDRLIREQALVARARSIKLDADPTVQRRMQAASNRVLGNELIDREVASQISEPELLERYRAEYTGKPGPIEVNARVILVPTEEQARGLLDELQRGGDFASLARRYSRDASAESDGDIGFIRQGTLVPELAAATAILEPGQLAPNPLPTRQGWYIVRLEARRQGPPLGFAEVREQLRREMLQMKAPRVVQDALDSVVIHRFNMDGTVLTGPDETQRTNPSPDR
jgi:peptidyl-prolyl cis-trans isomerase C